MIEGFEIENAELTNRNVELTNKNVEIKKTMMN